jgi:conjugal transfer pilus assembly protein TraB
MRDSFKDRWDAFGPNSKRGLAVGGIVAAGLGIVSVIANFAPEPAQKADKQQVVKHILTDSDPRSLGIDGLATQLKQVAQKNEDLLRRLAGLEEEQKRSRLSDEERLRRMNEEQATSHQGQIESLRSEIESLRRAKDAASEKTDTTGTQAILPPVERERLPRMPTAKPPSHQDLDTLFAQPPTPAPYGGSTGGVGPGQPQASGQNKGRLEIRVIKPEPPKGSSPGQDVPASQGPTSQSEVFIPAGSILSGHLLNGLDAPTGKGARKEPFPVLARLKEEAILPNRYRADVRECFLVSAGYGDLSSERAYIRGESISCVRDDGGVIEVPIDAYAVGEDGKVGIRGRVVSKQGQLLGNALLAGFLRGFSDAFGRNQTQVLALTGPAGVATTPFQRSFSESAMEGGTLKGAGYAMDRLAHYYMDMAENLFPIIEVDATRKIEFIVQKGTPLRLYARSDARNPHPPR